MATRTKFSCQSVPGMYPYAKRHYLPFENDSMEKTEKVKTRKTETKGDGLKNMA